MIQGQTFDNQSTAFFFAIHENRWLTSQPFQRKFKVIKRYPNEIYSINQRPA